MRAPLCLTFSTPSRRSLKRSPLISWSCVLALCQVQASDLRPPQKTEGPQSDQKKIENLARNVQSRPKFLVSLEYFNLDVSISPTKIIGPRWVARSKISFSLEIFNLASKSRFFFDLWALWENSTPAGRSCIGPSEKFAGVLGGIFRSCPPPPNFPEVAWIQGAAKGGRQKEFNHFFRFRDSFGHFSVTFWENRMGGFRKGGFSNNRFVLKPDVAIASGVSILSKNSLAITDFHGKKMQHVQLLENPLPGTPPPHSRFPNLFWCFCHFFRRFFAKFLLPDSFYGKANSISPQRKFSNRVRPKISHPPAEPL